MQYLYLLIIVACAMGNNIFKNAFAKGEICTEGDNAIYNAIACFIGAPLSMLGHRFLPISGPALLYSFLFGLSMAGVAITTIRALRTGPMAVTALFGNFAMVIPIFFAFFFWHERISLPRILGIAVMFFAIFLMIYPGKKAGKEDKETVSREWTLWVSLYALTTGLMALFQQMAAKSHPEDSTMFLFYGFLFATFFVLLYALYCRKEESTRAQFPFFSRQNFNGLFVGILGGISHISAMAILTLMDSAVFYPVKDGICIICNALLGRFLLKERLSKRRMLGFVLGAISILALTVLN